MTSKSRRRRMASLDAPELLRNEAREPVVDMPRPCGDAAISAYEREIARLDAAVQERI